MRRLLLVLSILILTSVCGTADRADQGSLPQSGQVKGVLVDADSKAPLGGEECALVLLGPLKKDGSRQLHFNKDLRAKSNEKGAFLFDKVPPGEYSIMMEAPPFGVSVQNNKGSIIVVVLKPGEIRDLGSIPVERKKGP